MKILILEHSFVYERYINAYGSTENNNHKDTIYFNE